MGKELRDLADIALASPRSCRRTTLDARRHTIQPRGAANALIGSQGIAMTNHRSLVAHRVLPALLGLAVPLALIACAGSAATREVHVLRAASGLRAIESLRTGAADAVVADYPVVAHEAHRSAGAFTVAGAQFDATPFGLGVRKDAHELNAALTDALRRIVADGTYAAALREAGLSDAAVAPPEAITTVPDAAHVPQLRDGFLQVGMEVSYPPMEYYDPDTHAPRGIDVDLANALARALGVRVDVVNLPFDGFIGALTSGRVDVIISSMGITEERSRQIDQIPYFTAGTGILVPSANPHRIAGIDDLCGLRIAVQSSTTQAARLDRLNRGRCAR